MLSTRKIDSKEFKPDPMSLVADQSYSCTKAARNLSGHATFLRKGKAKRLNLKMDKDI
jgi:hypothetical protein